MVLAVNEQAVAASRQVPTIRYNHPSLTIYQPGHLKNHRMKPLTIGFRTIEHKQVSIGLRPRGRKRTEKTRSFVYSSLSARGIHLAERDDYNHSTKT
jgi:hypothetical protein